MSKARKTEHIIHNLNVFSDSPALYDALTLAAAGIAAVLPETLISDAVRYDHRVDLLTICKVPYHLNGGRVYVFGAGKASGAMAEKVEEVLGVQRISDGVIATSRGRYALKRLRAVTAGHPVPDGVGLGVAQQLLSLRQRVTLTEDDLILLLISGGGSAMLPAPAPGLSLGDLQETGRLLVTSGASINEINAVRKHLSLVKGGRLGSALAPARVVSLIISDVVGDDLSTIASGPTTPDPTTFDDAMQVLIRRSLIDEVPDTVRRYLKRGCDGEIQETAADVPNCKNFIIGSNGSALRAIEEVARARGLQARMITTPLQGDTREAAEVLAGGLFDDPSGGLEVIIAGGETVTTVPCDAGLGGRNQHFAASLASALRSFRRPWAAACVGTDGEDYLKDVAGAVVDERTVVRAAASGIDIEEALERFDTYPLFKALGAHVITGPTGTNVGDLVILVVQDAGA